MLNYNERMNQIWNRLKELSKVNYAKYSDYSKGTFTKEYTEEQKLINEYKELQELNRALDPSYKHNQLHVSMSITGATAIQSRINYATALNI